MVEDKDDEAVTNVNSDTGFGSHTIVTLCELYYGGILSHNNEYNIY